MLDGAFTFGSLFAGIGGIDLGLERAGMVCKWQVEIDDYATRVLEKHWPDVARFRDVRDCGAWNLEAVDLIAGGFPCQDISQAGQRAGIEGERSGLWSEFHRIVCELRPGYVLVENVAALLNRGMGRVLGDLAACGYDAEWQCLPAAAFGAPHIRDRVFIFANLNCGGSNGRSKPGNRGTDRIRLFSQEGVIAKSPYWATNAPIRRVANGIPHRVDRLRGLGNAVVPQVAEWIGTQIMEYAYA